MIEKFWTKKDLREFVKEHNFQSVEHIQSTLKKLFKDLLEEALQAELDTQLAYDRYDAKSKKTKNSRNGFSKKTVSSEYGTSKSRTTSSIPPFLSIHGSVFPERVLRSSWSLTVDLSSNKSIISSVISGLKTTCSICFIQNAKTSGAPSSGSSTLFL
ncbi:transposase [Paenibacillus sp. P26]|nr:transposase [Paenibacillus sp. P26]UUZ93438.1 transposase [Paenibacillus sp. P25]